MKKLEFELPKKDSTSPRVRGSSRKPLEQLRKSALDGIKDFIQDSSDSLKEVGWVKYFTHKGVRIDPPNTEQWLTSIMMAKKLGVSMSTVQRWIKPMRGKYIRSWNSNKVNGTGTYKIYRFSSVIPLILYDTPQKGSGSAIKKQSKATRVKEKSKKKPLSQQELDISVSQLQEAAEGVENMNYKDLLERYLRCIISETGVSHTEQLHKHYTERGNPLFTRKEMAFLVNTGDIQVKQFKEELIIVQRRVSVIYKDWITMLNEKVEHHQT